MRVHELAKELVVNKNGDSIRISLAKPAGDVYINDKHICIEFLKKDLPSDDIIASRMLRLAVLDLREQIHKSKERDNRIVERRVG